MSILTFDLDHTKELPSKPLKDVETDLISATVGLNASPPALDGISFKATASANGSIQAYSHTSDTDDNGVIGTPVVDKSAAGKIVLPPQIPFGGSFAWLKFRFVASANVSAAGKVAPIEFKIDKSKKITFADYHVHDQGDDTLAAAKRDIPNLRFTANINDIIDPNSGNLKILENEALFYSVSGEFSASVTLSWSDIFTAAVSHFASDLAVNQLFMFEIDASASVEFHVGVVDDFQLVLTKGAGSDIRVALKKSRSDEIGISAGFQVVAKFADEKKVEEVLDGFYEATIGKPLGEITKILNTAANEPDKLISELPSPLKEIAEFVISRLKWEPAAVKTLKDFADQISALENKIKDTLASVAKAKVELGFKYEYLRVSTDDTLLVMEIDPSDFKTFHKGLMICDYIGLLEWARENPQSVKRYLHETTIDRKQSWGFTLGFMKWSLGGTEEVELRQVTQEDLQKKYKRIAYHGLRSYSAKDFILGNFSWSVDLKAEMNDFSVSPLATDFEYGLYIRRDWAIKTSEKNLRAVLDDALIWQVLTVRHIQDVVNAIDAKNDLGKDATVSIELTIPDGALRSILSRVGTVDNLQLGADALAMAMDYIPMYETRANNLSDRQRIYSALWKDCYFNNPNLDTHSYAATALSTIQHLSPPGVPDEAALSHYEGDWADKNPSSFANEIRANGGSLIKSRWENFTEGLTMLNKALKPGTGYPYKTVEDVFKLINPFWQESLYIRAVGVYLVRLAFDAGVLQNINRACTMTIGKNAYNFGKSI